MLNAISFNREKDKNLLTALKLEEKEFDYMLSQTVGEQLSIQSEILNAEKLLSNALKIFKNPTLFDQNNQQDETILSKIIQEYLMLLNLKLEESIKYYEDYKKELEAYSLKVEGANRELLQKVGYLYALGDIYKWVFVENFLNNFQISNEETNLNINNEVGQATLPIARLEKVKASKFYILEESDCILGNINNENKFAERLTENNGENIFSVHNVNQNCLLTLEIDLGVEATINFFKINFSKKSKVKSPQIKSILIYSTDDNSQIELSSLTNKSKYSDLLNESYGTYFTPIKTKKLEIKINQNNKYFFNGRGVYPLDIESIDIQSVYFQSEGSLKSEVFQIEKNVFNLESKVSVFPENDGYEVIEQLRVDGRFKNSKEGLLVGEENDSSQYFIKLKKREEFNSVALAGEEIYDYKKQIVVLFDMPNYISVDNKYLNSKIKIFANKNTSITALEKFKSVFRNNKLYIEIEDDFILDSVNLTGLSNEYEIWEENNVLKGIIVDDYSNTFQKVRRSENFTELQNYLDFDNEENIIRNSFSFELGIENTIEEVPYVNGLDEFSNSKKYKERIPVESVVPGEIVTFKLSKTLDGSNLLDCRLYQYGEVISSGFSTLAGELDFDKVYIDENNMVYVKTSENVIFEGYEVEYRYEEGEEITNSFSFDSNENRLYFSEGIENATVEVSYEKTTFDIEYAGCERLNNFKYDSKNEEIEINDELNGSIEIFLPLLKNSVNISNIKNYYSPIIHEVKIGGS